VNYLVIDYETASACDLKACGSARYSEDPTTEILCLSMRRENGTVETWRPGAPVPLVWQKAMLEKWPIIVHNATFEKDIYRNIQVPEFGWPPLPEEQVHCTLAACALKGIPQGLDLALAKLRLPGKDKAGSRFTISLSKPNRKGYLDRSPEAIARVVTYCESDTEVEEALHRRLGFLDDHERKVYLHNQVVNRRGVKLDLPFIEAAQRVVDLAAVPLAAEFTELTGVNFTQGKEFLKWCHGQGAMLPNLTKETVEAALGAFDDPEDEPDTWEPTFLPPPVKRALEIRQLVNSSSIKKLKRLQQCVSIDGRARNALQYHGTLPGRNAGRLWQPQNFPRGTIKGNPDELVAAIMTGDPDYVAAVYGPPVETVASSLRHALIAEKDHVFFSGDYAGIQARVVLALSGQWNKLELMASGQDVYCDMAAQIFKRPITKDDKEERQYGKNCFGADTKVLTSHGVKRIVEVKLEDKLWDGENWVNHQGLVSRGMRETVQLMGVSVTPEHPILVENGWVPAREVEHNRSILQLALATGSANLPSWEPSMEREVGSSPMWFNALVGRHLTMCRTTTCEKVLRPGATSVRSSRPTTGANTFMVTRISCRMRTTASAYLTASRRVFNDATLLITNIFPTMGVGASLSMGRGAPTEKHSYVTSSASQGGMSPSLSWTARTWTKAMSRVISGLYLEPRIAGTNDPLPQCSDVSSNWKPVFDLANAGPRHRFTIITDAGPLIVHNSVLGLGFGMGAKKFHLKYCVDQPLDFAETIVGVYRKEWAPNVPKLWRGLMDASTRAVHTGKRQETDYGICYYREDAWLVAAFPGGSKIYYYNPVATRESMPWDDADVRPGWTFNATKMGKWLPIKAFGGLLTENAVMHIEREIMVHGMLTLEANGFPVVLDVHDEILCEVPECRADLKAFTQIMEQSPAWVKQYHVPLKSDPWQGSRYRK